MTDRFECERIGYNTYPHQHPNTHSKISLDRMQADHGDRDGGHCVYCGQYVRKVEGDYRWAATVLILEWP